MTEAAMLSLSGAVILLLLGIIAFMLRQDRKGIAESIKAGFDEVKALISAIDARQRLTEKDCVTWADMEKERLRITEHDRRITIIETTCKSEHGK